MQAKSKNLIIGCIATMAIVATISTVHGHVCLDKPFTSHEHTWEIIEIKEGKEYISCPCGCMKHEITITSGISHALKGILYFFVVTVDAMRVVTLVCLRKCQFDTSQAY